MSTNLKINTKSKGFSKCVEDFVCANCKTSVKGNGFTNHCPNCLWSKHVDINPGDRNSRCSGMMEPIASIYATGRFTIAHKCIKCHTIKRVKSAYNDNPSLLLSISANPFPLNIK